MCFSEGDLINIYSKGTSSLLGQIKIKEKTCPKMFNRLVFFKFNLLPTQFSWRKQC